MSKFTYNQKGKDVQFLLISIEALANRLIREAVEANATDIHIVPKKKESHLQFRISHSLYHRMTLPQAQCDRLISHFKFTASMDIGERRRPQSGAISTKLNGQDISLRLSTLPATPHESLVIRLLADNSTIPIDKISLFPNTSKKLLSLLKYAHGLVLFTGPTGSGKTSTLYSLLNSNSHLYKRKVISLEDPIEKPQDNVLQVQVNEKAGITYASGLRAILRHDPDIIMVGEIRDADTARIAVRASLTGHLVLATMHTRDAKGAIYRLMEFGISRVDIQQTLIAVTAQRLVELVCPYCSTDCPPFCFNDQHRSKRASVFEIMTGKLIQSLLAETYVQNLQPKPALKEAIGKGIALGYVKETEYARWIYED